MILTAAGVGDAEEGYTDAGLDRHRTRRIEELGDEEELWAPSAAGRVTRIEHLGSPHLGPVHDNGRVEIFRELPGAVEAADDDEGACHRVQDLG